MRQNIALLAALCALLASGCAAAPASAELPTATLTPLPTVRPSSTPAPTATAAPALAPGETPPPATPAADTPVPTPYPEPWMNLPVIPEEVSEAAREVYAFGRARGNNPHSFSIIGDCQSTLPFFLGSFERPDEYSLGEEYAYLQEVIDWFAGSFYRERYAVGPGCTVASVQAEIWADPEDCLPTETPLLCEYRRHLPSFMIVTMERKDYRMPIEDYEWYLRGIVEFCIANGVVPIIATKADNLEGDHSINRTMVKVAQEYEMPVWNFWRAVQPLPHQGLRIEHGDEFHLTWRPNHFDDPEAMQYAWPWRNLTALQALDAVWRAVRVGS
jgi:hypothetical protein